MNAAVPFGSWRSPITAEMIVADSLGLGQVVIDGADVYWSETRPVERGRNVIVRACAGRAEESLPAPFSARSRVHEYGGGAFAVAGGVVYFCADADQRVYRVHDGAAPQPLTRQGPHRYADLVVDRGRQRLIAVCEDHGTNPVRNSLVAIPFDGVTARTLVSGADFYAAPRLSPDGKQLAWLSWRHPDMPWDGTELWLAELSRAGELTQARCIAGGRDESILQPMFAPDGTLYFVSDRGDWWNLFRWCDNAVQQVSALEAEVGWPQWIFGESAYAFLSSQQVLLACNRGGAWRLGLLHPDSARIEWLESPCNEVHSLVAADGVAAFVGASPTQAPAVFQFNARSREFKVLRRSTANVPDPGYLSIPRALEFPSTDGATAHAFFYPPTNQDFAPGARGLPPLLVLSHGGPTSAASPALNLKLQYWTSRGFAVLDVNYRGSTGFGRQYRRALYGHWGVADVDDCVHGARFLVEQGRVNADQLAIRGSSAGGYTTLCALAFRDVFHAGAVHYGISDLEALTRDTHKFEQHYTDELIGPYPARRDLYLERSPIHHVAQLSCPVIFFQGLEDKVVPPDQTRKMAQALRAKGIPVVCVEFEAEAHGFRRAENIRRALEDELYFYGSVFGFQPAVSASPEDGENP